MALIGVRSAAVLGQIAVVLRQACRRVVLQLHAADRLAERVEAVEADVVPLSHREGHLQAVVVRRLIRVEEENRTERGVGAARQNVRARRSSGGCHHRIVHVTLEGEVAVERSDVCGADGQRAADLTLDADVGLVGVGPTENPAIHRGCRRRSRTNRYRGTADPTKPLYGLLSDAPNGTPSAVVRALMLVNVKRVDHGWKLVIAFHSLPEMLP